ncbi:AraC family transcriptional regulator [Vibrio nitrifigilis]|uniref:Helix-turn-helix transcriptional regulator n=1 Tax=Vibrio nitrifigilis TaxID=2789781 RepID=A0ABS0GGF5_9VIBR|nr:helix-turn-helix transcriptional regulator [Vibrio nitrifigilis]MBF9001501.1 helix-turn-helix transcriptional regulator [Vibrio nitrifigilis]
MTDKRQKRAIPNLETLPRPVWARPENWGKNGTITEWHQHTWGQLSYAASGVLKVKTMTSYYVSPPNFGIWIPTNTQHQVISDDAVEMRSLYIADNKLKNSIWQSPLVCEITPLVRELIIHFCNHSPYYDKDSKQERLAQVIIDQLESLSTLELELPYPTDKRLAQICELLQKQPSTRLNINEWGKRVGLTGRSISRLFMSQTGMTFQRWRQRVRLIHALSLLQKSEPVTLIAYQCGYDSLSAFNEAFKQQFGCTAGQFQIRNSI